MRKSDLINHYKKACKNLQRQGLCSRDKENAELTTRVQLLEAENARQGFLLKEAGKAFRELIEGTGIKAGESCER